jgi:hypothetical protein
MLHSFAIYYFCAHHLYRPHLLLHGAVRIQELILCDILFGNHENISSNKTDCTHLLYLAPTQMNNAAEGRWCSSDYPYSHSTKHQAQTLYIHKSLTKTFRTEPPYWVNLAPYINQALLRIWSLWRWVSFVSHMRFNLSQCGWWLSSNMVLCGLACMPLPISCNLD